MSNDLSRRPSRQPILADDTTSLTSFPDPAESVPSTPPAQAAIAASPLDNEELSPNVLEAATRPLSTLLNDGPSMFDEQDTGADDPQTLSVCPDGVLESIVEHRGALELVRHLATLLAERDAHVTALIRLAEQHNIPAERISETSDRVRQAERRRLSLAAASEDLASINTSRSHDFPGNAVRPETTNGTIKGLTRLFGGGSKRQDSLVKTGASVKTATSSRSASIAPLPPTRNERPTSADVLSITSTESSSWVPNIFDGSTIKGFASLANGIRRDSRSSREPREPVEMNTRHDRDQLPPTLSAPAFKDTNDPRSMEWNKFLLRLMKMREQTGEEAKSGELVGASRWGHEGTSGKQKMDALTRLIIGGIPMRLRHPIWMELSDTYAIMQPEGYQHYLELRDSEDPLDVDAILKDVPRTLTSKYDYYAERGYDRLKKVLIAFVGKYPGLGYTQGLNMIAGYLLLAIPDESDAFWVLCNMVDAYFPANYFSKASALSGAIADNAVLRQYVHELLPRLSEKLAQLGIPVEHTVPLSWFLTAFASVLPENVLLRIWDVWLCLPGQKTFLFNVALALLSLHQKDLLECEYEDEYYAYMSSSIRLPDESPEKVNELIRQAFMLRKRLEGVEGRRKWEGKNRLKRVASMEALYDRDGEESVVGNEGEDEER